MMVVTKRSGLCRTTQHPEILASEIPQPPKHVGIFEATAQSQSGFDLLLLEVEQRRSLSQSHGEFPASARKLPAHP